MNWDDFDYLFDPGAGTQAPILKRAIGLAKNEIASKPINLLSKVLESSLKEIIDVACGQEQWKFNLKREKNKNYDGNNEILQLSAELKKLSNSTLNITASALDKLGARDLTLGDKNSTIQTIVASYNKYKEESLLKQITSDKNIDLPTWFNYQELITKFIDAAIVEHEGSNSKITEYVSTLRLRLESFLNDQRIAEPLLLKTTSEFSNSLSFFLAFVIGDFHRLFNTSDKDIFTQYYSTVKKPPHSVNQVSILDLSLVPFDVLETLTGLIGRLIIEFVAHFSPADRGKYPIVLILEEAQNYIPAENRKDTESVSKKVFERIAREGRKYGISLIVSSQRPAELSKTVLSQCNSFIVHRLQNPEDQKYIRGLVSSANGDLLGQLPILPQQHAIVMGDCVRTPVQTKINNVDPKPNSDNPKFIDRWLSDYSDFPDYKNVCEKWKSGTK